MRGVGSLKFGCFAERMQTPTYRADIRGERKLIEGRLSKLCKVLLDGIERSIPGFVQSGMRCHTC